jgi:predicted esterase
VLGAARFARLKRGTRPKLLVFKPKRIGEDTPIIVALHGQHWTARSFADSMKAEKLANAYIMCIPQSSQPFAEDIFCWDDRALAKKEIYAWCRKIAGRFRQAEDNLIISGMSQGGALAIEMSLEGKIHPKGFIAIAPALKELKEKLLRNPGARKLRGVIIVGDKDMWLNSSMRLYASLQRHGTRCKLVVVRGMSHEIPKDVVKKMDAAVNFILAGS